jgi:hypothetical protein
MWPGNAAKAQPEASSQWDVWLAAAALIAMVALGTWAIYRVKRWREETAEEAADTPETSLDHYQQLMEDGLLDPDEFTKIKERLENPMPIPTPPKPNQPPDTAIHEK